MLNQNPTKESRSNNMKNLNVVLLSWMALLGGIENGQCFYNPQPGRWLSRDPIGEVEENLYGFCNNSPMVSIDPDGRISVSHDELKKFSCGGWSVNFTYTLDGNASCKGYIVQMVTITENIAPCGGPYVKTVASHWERVPKVNPMNSTPTIETTAPDLSASVTRKNTKGFRGVDVKLKFFCEPLDFTGWTPSDPSWGFSTFSAPAMWSNPSAPGEAEASRSVSAAWNCCCPPDVGAYSIEP
jgi:hypothetical protein